MQGLRKKRKLTPSWFLGLSFFIGVLYLSIINIERVTNSCMQLQLCATFLLLAFFCVPRIARTPLKGLGLPSLSYPASLLLLVLIQTVFFIISCIFFHTLEYQTQLGLRIPRLFMGEIFALIKENPWSLGFCPWALYGVLGVGLSYCANRLHRAPTLPDALFPEYPKHPQLFLHNFFQIIVGTVTQVSIAIALSLVFVLMCEGLNLSFDHFSLFEYPLRTLITFAIVVIVFRKQNLKLINMSMNSKVPLGGILILYALMMSLLMYFVNIVESWLELNTLIFNVKGGQKTMIMQMMSVSDKKARLMVLVWGFWSMFIPALISFIARLSCGRSVITALFNTLIFPALVFLYLLPQNHLIIIQTFTLSPWICWFFVMLLLLVLMMSFGRTFTVADIVRGAMPMHPSLRPRSIKRWVRMCLLGATSYLAGLFGMGWLQAELILSLGAFFMWMVTLSFIVGLCLVLFRFLGEEKYKVQTVP